MGLLGRNAPLRIHARPELEGLMQPQLDYFCRDLPFQVEFVSFDPGSHSLVYEDRSLEVYCFPLRHRVKSAGFLFREKPRQRHMIKEMIDFYGIPLKEIPAIKGGADFVDSEGRLIANDRLTRPPKAALSYAFCSDTAYDENIVKYVKGVNLLYHEATFGDDLEELAESTTHSTASQAARIAQKAGVGKLIIGHYSARYTNEEILLQQAQAIFPNTELADEGKCFDVAALRETKI
jgi:ribonuclease Z